MGFLGPTARRSGRCTGGGSSSGPGAHDKESDVKRFIVGALLAFAAISAAVPREVESDEGASLVVTTRTSFGVDLDHPERYGLRTEFPRLGLYIRLIPWQNVTNKVNSDDPIGFIDLNLGINEIRFTNGAFPDDNNPGERVGMGWNDPTRATGYFAPLYLEGMQAGIAWDNFVFQLAAGGDDTFWKPWNRNLSRTNEALYTSWAFMDTRVMYRRTGRVSDLGIEGLTGWNLFTYDTVPNPSDSLARRVGGTMVGLQYTGEASAWMLKTATEYDWRSDKITQENANGVSFGLDFALTPPAPAGLRLLGSVTAERNYGPDEADDPVFGGVRLGYDMPVAGLRDVSIEPYAGYDMKLIPETGTFEAHELSGGFTIHWPGTTGWAYDYIADRPAFTDPGLTAAYTLYLDRSADADPVHSVMVTLLEGSGDAGMLLGVGSEIVLEAFDLTKPSSAVLLSSYFDLSLEGVLGGTLVPWTKIFYDNVGNEDGSRSHALKVDLGLKLHEAIRNTVFGIAWQSGDLLIIDPVLGHFKTYVELSL
jgi:hypothetical protein